MATTQTALGEFRPPYLSFQSFLNFLDRIPSNKIPPQIDRSVLGKSSGSTQAQLMVALKSFELIDDDLAVQDALKALIKGSEAERKDLIGDLVRHFYPEQLKLAQANATFQQLRDSFVDTFDISGETVVKAIRFFLQVLDYVEIEASQFWTAPRTSATPRRKRTGPKKASGNVSQEDEAPTQRHSPGSSKSITLGSGGTLTLSMTFDLFALSSDDRAFVFGLIDQMRSYEVAQEVDDAPF